MQSSASWSERFAQHYQLELDDSLIDWFDNEAWRLGCDLEFNQPVAPGELLSESPEVLWPGLMMPDCIPFVGNGQGDWLCLRIGADNRVQEVIHWYHGGGDWIPWGSTLEESLFFDAARYALPGQRAVHAISAEPLRKGNHRGPLTQWALQQLPAVASTWIDKCLRPNHATSVEDAKDIARENISGIAVRCELILWALESPIRRHLTPEIASRLGVNWESTAAEWIFDHSRIPQTKWAQLQQELAQENGFAQDWDLAVEQAHEVLQIRSDLGWAWDICAWQEEQNGRQGNALELFLAGSLASSFSDQSVRFRTHWFPETAGKFSCWRAHELLNSLPSQSESSENHPLALDYVQFLAEAPAGQLRKSVTQFWLHQAELAFEMQRPDVAYELIYRAGWDLGTESMQDYRRLLASLANAAERAGQYARARLASIHRNTLVSRFG